jgi:toxin-antitoxin system PIN domain toxin
VSRRALLDINLLIALFDPSHVHHEAAHAWFADNRSDGWATCPLTELGFVRVLSNPALGDPAGSATSLLAQLRKFCASGDHEFWPDAVSLRDETVFDLAVVSHRQLTDVYLLGLAWTRRGRLATFDRSIPLKAVIGAAEATLEVISPAGG